MNCWYCGTELIWGGDIDIDHEDYYYCISSNFSCPNEDCKADVIMYLPKEERRTK